MAMANGYGGYGGHGGPADGYHQVIFSRCASVPRVLSRVRVLSPIFTRRFAHVKRPNGVWSEAIGAHVVKVNT